MLSIVNFIAQIFSVKVENDPKVVNSALRYPQYGG